jgi:hypothetical protein
MEYVIMNKVSYKRHIKTGIHQARVTFVEEKLFPNDVLLKEGDWGDCFDLADALIRTSDL